MAVPVLRFNYSAPEVAILPKGTPPPSLLLRPFLPPCVV
jgi:hypothetical protein